MPQTTTPDEAKLSQALQKARKLAEEMVAERCQTDLFYLCKEILGYDLMTEFTHGDLCKWTQSILPDGVVDKSLLQAQLKVELPDTPPVDNYVDKLEEDVENYIDTAGAAEIQDSYDAMKKMLLLMMPRNTFKSSVVTIGLSLQYMLNDANCRILLDSETYSKSKAFLAEIKGHLEDNPKYRQVYHTIHGCYPDDAKKDPSVRWKDSEIDVAARKKKRKEPTISCSGIDVTKNGMHYDLIICDDLHSEKNTTNKEQIEQVIDHWKLALSLLEPNKYMVVIGTRWDYNDLYQYLLDEEADRFNVFVRQAILPDGTLLFPEVLDEAFLEAQKKSQGTYIFSCQYMNDPIDNETATFKKSYFQYKKWEDIKDRPMNWYLLVDPSYEGPYSDYAALVECGMDFMGELYVGDVHRMKLTYSGIINMMFDLHMKRKYKMMTIETVATQKSLGYMLNDEQRRRQVWLPVKEIVSRNKTKEERIRGLAPYYETARIWHIKDARGISELEYELLHFPKAKYDDCSDALSTVLEVATPPRAIDSEDKRQKKRKAMNLNMKPRSPITGV